LQAMYLACAEALGADGRPYPTSSHPSARQLVPLSRAGGRSDAKTAASRSEAGDGVIDMRYEPALHGRKTRRRRSHAGGPSTAARLSRGLAEQVIEWMAAFRYRPDRKARRRRHGAASCGDLFRLAARCRIRPAENPRPMFPKSARAALRLEPILMTAPTGLGGRHSA